MAVSTWTSNGLYVPQHHHPHQQYGCHMSSAYQPHHQQYPHPQHQQQPYATISRTSSSTLKRRPAYDPIIPIPYSSSPPPSPCSSSRSPPFTPAQATRLYCVVVHNFYCHNNKPNSSTPATALTLPPHSLSTFVSRLVRASGVSTQIILLALIYVFRLRPHGSSSSSSSSSSLLSPASASIPSTTLQKPTSPLDPSPPQFHIPSPPASPCPPDLKHYDLDPTTSPLHTLVATTIILAQKVTDDNRFTNKTWSELANIRLETINSRCQTDNDLNNNIQVHDNNKFPPHVQTSPHVRPVSHPLRPYDPIPSLRRELCVGVLCGRHDEQSSELLCRASSLQRHQCRHSRECDHIVSSRYHTGVAYRLWNR
ncbi:hypothetical protein BC832DRAFT_84445 [Gaertneriomyces semiglobifer]|nr:hypothetical protein BC832DRAFT_84445 [Gaertneriomyces semiglobifer]